MDSTFIPVECFRSELIDLSDFQDDLYICDEGFDWTMVYSHESMGPYFYEVN